MAIRMERKYILRRMFIGLPLALMGAYAFLKFAGLIIAMLGVLTGEFA